MTAMVTEGERCLGISEATGLSPDTLRWYECEGAFPRGEQDTSRGRRCCFSSFVSLGAISSGPGPAWLAAGTKGRTEMHRDQLVRRAAELLRDRNAIDADLARIIARR
jgi:hypothetical protein